MRKTLLFALLIVAIAGFTVFPIKPKKDLSTALARISRLYLRETGTLDSFLKDYPRYFYDSPFAVREKKYEELCYYFKRSTSFCLYFEPDLYYKKLVRPLSF